MATITFRAKVEHIHWMDGTIQHIIRVPKLTRHHCDMTGFRNHPKYGMYANSDLFPGMLAKIREGMTGGIIDITHIPEGVTVDAAGFLATVTMDV